MWALFLFEQQGYRDFDCRQDNISLLDKTESLCYHKTRDGTV